MRKPTRARGAGVPLLLAAVLLILPWSLPAQIPEGVEGPYRPSQVAERAIAKIESPWCPGLMLSVCPAEESRALRDSIHGYALEGWTTDELVDWVLASHGEQYLAVPRGRGVGLWAWIMPPIFLLIGAGVLVTFLRRFRPTEEIGLEDLKVDEVSEDDLGLLEAAVREADRAEE